MMRLTLFFFLCFMGFHSDAQTLDLRSDSMDILHTEIRLDVRNAPYLSAQCVLHLQAKKGPINEIRLDLEEYTVDSVRAFNQKLLFLHNSPSLYVSFASSLFAGDSTQLEVFYHGNGPMDASGWGGIYNQGPYFYNLGVGFDSDPHNYGRAWFPCFDNFVERSTFEVYLWSLPARKTFSNGYLVSETLDQGILKRRWRMDTPIPSYLACFSSGPYISLKKQVLGGTTGIIPVEIAVVASDTSKVLGTFQHLQKAVDAFEFWYGPFIWNKIGYSLVPFQSGAMEHATNIAIMQSAITGNTANETLWAHELSHHWWGDLATCSTAEDMWLNEGWAVFSENLFTEWLYGKEAYNNAVQTDFLNVLQNAHVEEAGYRAVSGVPHAYTYGQHVYHKGAAVVHNLRYYLGDTLFRKACRFALENTQLTHWNSLDLRDKMETATGVNLHPFFNDWVFAPGFPHFSVDSFSLSAPNIDTFLISKVFIKQKLRGAPHYHEQVPLEVVFVNSKREKWQGHGMVSGISSILEFHLPLTFGAPIACWVNPNMQLLLARAEKERSINSPGQYSFSPAKMDIKVTSAPDTTLIRVEHHFVMPDSGLVANPGNYILTNRYWTVEGVFPNGFEASTNLFYDGRGKADQLDTELFAQTGPSEDSLVLLYRLRPGQPWGVYPFYTQVSLNSKIDKYGFFRLQSLLPGQYTLGKINGTLHLKDRKSVYGDIKIFPNPAQKTLLVQSEDPFDQIRIFPLSGVGEYTWNCPGASEQLLILPELPNGVYWLELSGKKGNGGKLVILEANK